MFWEQEIIESVNSDGMIGAKSVGFALTFNMSVCSSDTDWRQFFC